MNDWQDWQPLSIMKGNAVGKYMVESMQNEWGKKLYQRYLIQTVGRSLYGVGAGALMSGQAMSGHRSHKVLAYAYECHTLTLASSKGLGCRWCRRSQNRLHVSVLLLLCLQERDKIEAGLRQSVPYLAGVPSKNFQFAFKIRVGSACTGAGHWLRGAGRHAGE
jgi:hypothetical protein